MQFDPELQARIDQLVIETGYAAEKLAEDAMAGYVAELAATREMLDSCYDHLKIGRVKPVPVMSLLPISAKERLDFDRTAVALHSGAGIVAVMHERHNPRVMAAILRGRK